MSTLDIIFWLLIILVAVLAYAIESGLSVRHRPLVLSSIMSATLAVVYMMFIVEDNSSFGTGSGGGGKKKEEQQQAAAQQSGGGLPKPGEAGAEAAGGALPTEQRYEDGALLNKPGGFRDCEACPLMVKVEAGHVIIGSPDTEVDHRSNEAPQKVVNFKRPFTISRYEIQYREFSAFVEATSYRASTTCAVAGKPTSANWQKPGYEQTTADHPVVCLSWNDARAYAEWLTKTTKRTYRLPSEAEWEYSARAGQGSPYWTGPTITPAEANYGGAIGGTTRGGKYKNNGFKLFDMAGNVWEMTEDCWSDDLKSMPGSGVSELSQGDCTRSAVRGGAWNSPKPELRSAYRRPIAHSFASNTIGIRLVREIK